MPVSVILDFLYTNGRHLNYFAPLELQILDG